MPQIEKVLCIRYLMGMGEDVVGNVYLLVYGGWGVSEEVGFCLNFFFGE